MPSTVACGQRSRSVGVGLRGDGSFSSDDLKPGRYEAKLMIGFQGRDTVIYSCGLVDVGPGGEKGLKLVPRPQ